MTISDVTTSLSVDLNDQEPGFEYQRWTKFQLSTYVREAIALLIEDAKLASADLDGRIHHVVVKLDDTAGWQRSCDCGCEEIIRINGLSTASGEIIEVLPRLDDDEQIIWKNTKLQETCNCDEAYRGYVINQYNPCEFKISPPIVDGKDHYVELECYVSPSVCSIEADIPDKWLAPIRQWALYRALIVDSENNPTVIEVAKTHLETFLRLTKDAREVRVARRQELEMTRSSRLQEKYISLQRK